MKKENNECCPLFHPEKWNKKTFNWDCKPFVKTSVPTLFHIPFPLLIGKKVTKMMKMAEDSNKMSENMESVLLLFTDPHLFKSEIYLSVTGKVPNSNNTTISGTFMTKVFDGNYNAIPKFIRQMNDYLSKHRKIAKKYYVHYAYCPKCAKKYEHNYMVLFAKV
ncbi:hydrolase [Lutibacter sp.]|uniref:hydrolase n=1 Tax=Lutibacter sp. TaxID=1925666 RepID=UPI00356B0653